MLRFTQSSMQVYNRRMALLVLIAAFGVSYALYRALTGQWIKARLSKSWPCAAAKIEKGEITEFLVRGTRGVFVGSNLFVHG